MPNRTQYNINEYDLGAMFRNWIKGATISTAPVPNHYDADGYPITTLNSTLSLRTAIPVSYQDPSIQWVVKCIGTRSLTINTDSRTVTVVSSSGGAVTGGAGSAMTVSGSNWRVVFTFDTAVVQRTINFPSGGVNAAGTGDLVLCRLSDEAALDAGDPFLPEMVALFRDQLKPATLRWMPVNVNPTGNTSNLGKFAYRTTPSRISYNAKCFFPNLWGGVATGTDQYTVAAAPDTNLTGYTHGEIIQTTIANASSSVITISGSANNGGKVQFTTNKTTGLSPGQKVYVGFLQGTREASGHQTVLSVDSATTVTLDVNYSTAYVSAGNDYIGIQTLTVTGKPGGDDNRPILDMWGLPMDASTKIVSNVNCTFTYDAILDAWVYHSAGGGITANVPYEIMVDFSNKLACNVWFNFPLMWRPEDAEGASELVSDRLDAGLHAYFEVGNEIWNPTFMSTSQANQWGLLFGFSPGSISSAFSSMYCLLGKMMMDAVITGWGSRPRSELKCVVAQQHVNPVVTTRMNGSECVTGNARYNAFTATASSPGGRSFNTHPNRFVDLVDVYATGPYVVAASLRTQTFNSGVSPYWPTASIPVMQAIADAWNSGDTLTAIRLIDEDYRQGRTLVQTVTVGGASNDTFSGTETYTNGWLVRFTTAGTLPAGLSLNTAYFVVNASGTSFKVSATSGGAAITGITGGSGTLTVGRMGGGTAQTLLNHVTVYYPANAAVANGYTAQRAANGQAPIGVESYEGAMERPGLTSTVTDALGLTPGGSGAGSAYAAITAALDAWENSNYAQQFEYDYMAQCASFTNSKNPSHYHVSGPGIWSILSGDLTTAPSQLSEGARLYSSSKRRLVW